MSKIIMIIVAAAVVAGGGYYFLNSIKNQEAAQSVPVATTTDSTGKKMAFSAFLKQGGTYKCTTHQTIDGSSTVGTIYTDNGMLRGEYSTQVQGMKIDATFVIRDGFTYSWSSVSEGAGIKVKVVDTTEASGTPKASSYNFNADQIGDYDCVPWKADASKFTLPSNVTFTEFGAK